MKTGWLYETPLFIALTVGAGCAVLTQHMRTRVYDNGTSNAVNMSDDPTYEELLELEDVKVPTKAAILDRLPTHTHAGATALGDAICAVCMVDYEDGDTVTTLPCPGNLHSFHAVCIRKWLGTYSKKCPICNFVLDE